jgi:hypothetical protein
MMAVPLQLAAAAAAAIFLKMVKSGDVLLGVGSLSIVKVLQGLPVLQGPLVQQSTSCWTDFDHISFQ